MYYYARFIFIFSLFPSIPYTLAFNNNNNNNNNNIYQPSHIIPNYVFNFC